MVREKRNISPRRKLSRRRSTRKTLNRKKLSRRRSTRKTLSRRRSTRKTLSRKKLSKRKSTRKTLSRRRSSKRKSISKQEDYLQYGGGSGEILKKVIDLLESGKSIEDDIEYKKLLAMTNIFLKRDINKSDEITTKQIKELIDTDKNPNELTTSAKASLIKSYYDLLDDKQTFLNIVNEYGLEEDQINDGNINLESFNNITNKTFIDIHNSLNDAVLAKKAEALAQLAQQQQEMEGKTPVPSTVKPEVSGARDDDVAEDEQELELEANA